MFSTDWCMCWLWWRVDDGDGFKPISMTAHFYRTEFSKLVTSGDLWGAVKTVRGRWEVVDEKLGWVGRDLESYFEQKQRIVNQGG